MSITFMAKPNEREGNSCHIHLSLRGTDGTPVLAGRRPARRSPPLGEHFVAGQLAALRELTLLLRAEHQLLQAVRAGQLRADRGPLGRRQPHLRAAAGRARALAAGRRTGRPAATSTRTSRSPAMIAAGLHGIDNELPLEPAFEGNAYADDSPRVPHTLRDALELWQTSEIAARRVRRTTCVEHYANYAQGRAGRLSTPRSPTGSCAAASSACKDP